jgi:hypothetical protein
MMALIQAAIGDSAKLAAIGPYKSRGHGRGSPSRRYGNKPGKYMPHQGAQEIERRLVGGWYKGHVVGHLKRDFVAQLRTNHGR